jgi:hypothetical protein
MEIHAPLNTATNHLQIAIKTFLSNASHQLISELIRTSHLLLDARVGRAAEEETCEMSDGLRDELRDGLRGVGLVKAGDGVDAAHLPREVTGAATPVNPEPSPQREPSKQDWSDLEGAESS